MTWASRMPTLVPILARESLYVGIDVGKTRHLAGFVSTTLLRRHTRYEGCPALAFEQSREGFRLLVDRIREYVPLEQCFILVEKTGHYHLALVQYLQELDISVYMIHVQRRPKGMLKTDRRDALGLANHLYNQLEKGIQFASPVELARRMVPPTEAATLLRGLVRHRYELVREATQRKNKLTAICDELFPELTRVKPRQGCFTDPGTQRDGCASSLVFTHLCPRFRQGIVGPSSSGN
jgi:transposase